ncbi:hypothetical protein A2V82_02725 [candidate division KSB1 bacterium RBG_16_48_16]|nr:MAG: hypothetical protein A2V82_02725 [candidate division KSB1 bacterium RBG_16_48_16]
MNLLEKVTNHKVFTFFDRITGLIRIDTIKFYPRLILSILLNPVILSFLLCRVSPLIRYEKRETTMKRKYVFVGVLLTSLLLSYGIANAFLTKQIRISNYWTWIDDNTSQGEVAGAYRGFMYHKGHYPGWPSTAIDWAGWYMGCVNWTDENGEVWPIMLTGAPGVELDEQSITMPIPDEDGYYIRKYMRYQPPKIVVDGYQVQDPFPLEGDAVDVNHTIIPGTADLMVTSQVNTNLGVSVQQKVLAWSVENHDDYIIWDWTFTNTGNIDTDDEIELPDQTLDGLYFMRESRLERWDSFNWYSSRGEYESDTLRTMFAYPSRRSDSGTTDDTGDAIATGNSNITNPPGFLWNPHTVGAAICHVDKSADDPTDDFDQPDMTGVENSDLLWTRNVPTNLDPAGDWSRIYRVMSEGWEWNGNVPRLTQDNAPPGETVRPGYRSVRMEEAAVPGTKFITDLDWVTYGATFYWAVGPYTLKPGESFRVVWADGFGVMNPLLIWKIGTDWENGVCEPPEGMSFDQAAGVGLVDNMPIPYKNNPDLYNHNYNDWAKDCRVFTGIDSFIQNMNNAQWAVRNNYNVPIPPPPPSIEVSSQPNKIMISWGSESESAPDFAGYRLYRSEGLRYEGYIPMTGTPTREHGEWRLVKDFPGSAVHSYDDTGVTRGTAYFYYVTAYDDGASNPPDVKDSGAVLESGKYLNMTTRAAYLTREAGSSLKDIVIVPNPYNIAARELQFPGEPDKIMFYELPLECTIRIFTESGDLVKTIEHYGSGDEAWGATTMDHMTSDTGQIVVSGIYIANIQTPDGDSINRKIVIVR